MVGHFHLYKRYKVSSVISYVIHDRTLDLDDVGFVI